MKKPEEIPAFVNRQRIQEISKRIIRLNNNESIINNIDEDLSKDDALDKVDLSITLCDGNLRSLISADFEKHLTDIYEDLSRGLIRIISKERKELYKELNSLSTDLPKKES